MNRQVPKLLLAGLFIGLSGTAGGRLAAEPATAAATVEGLPSFNGIWAMLDYQYVIRPDDGDPPYTDDVKTRMKRYKEEFDPIKDDPALFCVAMGMPWRMLNKARDYPLEIYQTKDRIFILFEGHDDKRSINIGRTDVPENLPRSANGWSNAHWEGQTLVITTTNVTARSEIGLMQRSEDAVITERWTMKKDPAHGDLVDIDITIVDPPVYSRPVKAHQVYMRSPKGVEVGGYNCMDALWDEHLRQREAEITAKKGAVGK